MSEDEFRLFQMIAATNETPAFLRRSQAVEEGWNRLVTRCQVRREALLEFPRLRLATLFALLRDWQHVPESVCRATDLEELESLHRQWSPRLRLPVKPATSERELRQALGKLVSSFDRFNLKWGNFLNKIDLAELNHVRDKYNRYYLIEKECAMWSPEVAQRGFVPLAFIRSKDLFDLFPLLSIPDCTISRG